MHDPLVLQCVAPDGSILHETRLEPPAWRRTCPCGYAPISLIRHKLEHGEAAIKIKDGVLEVVTVTSRGP